MLRQHPFGDLTFDFKAGEKSEHESLAVDAAELLRHYERAAQWRNRRMGQKTVDMRRIGAHLAIVPVMRVAGGAEDAGRQRRGHFGVAPAQ